MRFLGGKPEDVVSLASSLTHRVSVSGVPAFTERSVEHSGTVPSGIYLFRHGIIAAAGGWEPQENESAEDVDDSVYEEIMVTLLHEIGHHAIGFNIYKPRCLEEYHAWRWSIEAMQANNLNITDAVRLRMHRSLWYAVQKASRRGIKRIPEELTPFMERPMVARRERRVRAG